MKYGWTRRAVRIEVGVLIAFVTVIGLLLIPWTSEYCRTPLWRWIDRTLIGSMSPESVAQLRSHIDSLLWTGRFNLITAAIAVVAMLMSLRPHRWWRWALIIAVAIGYTPVHCASIRAAAHLCNKVGVTDLWYVGLYTNLVLYTFVAVVVACTFRSWMVLFGCLAAGMFSAGFLYWLIINVPADPTDGGRPAPNWQFVIASIGQMLFACGFLTWAWRERRLRPVQGRCTNCGYDLRGTAHARCPECGAAAGAIAPA